MKKLLASALCAALVVTMQPISIVAAGLAAQNTGSLSGIANNSNGSPLSGVRVQLRNVDTGALVGNTTSATTGAYSFSGLAAGNYVVEIVDSTGKIIGTSASIAVAAGAVITGVTLAGGAGGAAAAAAAGGAAFFTSTGGILVLAGVGIGAAAGVVAATNDASPSQ